MGFGHPLYESIDPRSEVLREIAKHAHPEVYSQAAQVESQFHRSLKSSQPRRALPTNVEYYSAIVLQAIGLPPDLFITAFACARMTGWAAHFAEQRRQQEMGIVGVMHPVSAYIGIMPKADEL